VADDLKQYLLNHYQITLTPPQLEAVQALTGPVCVISCPGSGKTTVTVIRLANLIVKGQINSQRILALTFSKAAAQDMNKRFNHLFPSLASTPRFSTIHSFAYQIIRHYQQITQTKYEFIDANNPNPTTYSKKQILASLYLQITERYISEEELDTFISQIGLLKNLMIEPHHKEKIKPYIENDLDIFLQIYKNYETYKENHHLLDYDDLLTQAYQILVNHDNLRNFYQNQYSHIQVDEAQDISKIQSELIKLIALPENNLFLVGDDDQSIYAFRGAYPQQLLNFKNSYPDANMIYLSENFRSSLNIVQASSQFIGKNKTRYKKEIFTLNPTCEAPNFYHFKNDTEQANYLIEKIQKLAITQNIAILYRQNISAVSLLSLLNYHQIPFKLQERKLSFFKHPIVQDITAMIKLAQNGGDKVAFKRVAKILYLSASVTNQALAQQEADFLDYVARSITFKSSFQTTKIRQFKQNLPKLTTLDPGLGISYILKTLTYEDYLIKKGYLKEEKELPIYTQGIAILESLKGIANQCHDFEEFFNRLATLANLNQSSNGVSLLTFHAAKGLEFDYVFMVDCMNNITPSATALTAYLNQDPKEYEEERRLFYVAMTRAKYQLEILSVASKYNLLFNRSNFFKDANEIVNPRPASKSSESSLTRPSIQVLKQISPINLDDYPIDTKIHHQKFGPGKILDLEGEVATIQFDDEIRRISLKIALNNGSLAKIS